MVDDVAATLRWYGEKLGFEADGVPKPPPYEFGIAWRDGIKIYFQRLEGAGAARELFDRREGGVWHAYLQTDDVRAFHDALRDDPAVEIVQPLEHADYGQTQFAVRDPNGYVLVFAQRDSR